ncbi:MAG: hypothetical protein F6K24_47520 [Okeania sp. SIO2D1]|nr:hypothetical protein [Okeania sp. SIO2D1]
MALHLTWTEPMFCYQCWKQKQSIQDKADDAVERVIKPLTDRGVEVVIPPKKNRA